MLQMKSSNNFLCWKKTKGLPKKLKDSQRKRARKLLHSRFDGSPVTKQSRLPFSPKALSRDEVDDAWGEAFFGLDIAAYKIDNLLFREAIAATRKCKAGFVVLIDFCFVCGPLL